MHTYHWFDPYYCRNSLWQRVVHLYLYLVCVSMLFIAIDDYVNFESVRKMTQ